ncbi:hypothetical protein Hypma_009137, partial [Hypsizygus marmoreus]
MRSAPCGRKLTRPSPPPPRSLQAYAFKRRRTSMTPLYAVVCPLYLYSNDKFLLSIQRFDGFRGSTTRWNTSAERRLTFKLVRPSRAQGSRHIML